MAQRIPGSSATPRSPSVYREVPFSSELPLQPLAAHTDLLWTNPEEVSGINKHEVAGRISTRDLSTIQQFEALHLSAERGGAFMGGLCLIAWRSVRAWVYVGESLNVFMLMTLIGQLSTPCLDLANLQSVKCKTSE